MEPELANPESELEAAQLAVADSARGSDAGRVPLVQRAFEIVVALVMLVLTIPIMLVIAIIIKLDSPGPALFFQDRLGINGKHFKFVKFRTLFADARTRFPELYRYQYTKDEIDVMRFKIDNDPRVTPAGRWLRESSLDELPNFWNVLSGHMALVGPRPEIPEMMKYYVGEMKLKFAVRPGVTGLAQIGGRGRLSFKDTVALDVEYVKVHSFRGDLRILFTTLKKIVLRDGAF